MSESTLKTVSDMFDEYHSWATDPRPRIGLGYPFFDGPTNGGIARGEICQLMARSSVGKTWAAINIVRNNPDVPIVFFSLEMAAPYIAARLAAVDAGVSTTAIENEVKRTGTHQAVASTIDKFRKLIVVDKPAMSVKDMSAALAAATERFDEDVRLVVIDYLELIGGVAAVEQVAQIDKVAKRLKDWTRENHVATVVLHQMSRGAGEEGHLALSMTSGRFGGESAADYIVGMHRDALRPGLSITEYQRVADSVHF